MPNILNGATAMGSVVAGLLFLRFWRESGDRFFVTFAVAFWIFAIDYGILAFMAVSDESRPYVFALRLAGFVAILWGIAMKNRATQPRA